MQTTLRIDDQLYREAKAEAAREGTTLTRFLEEGIRLRLQKRKLTVPHSIRIYDPEAPSAAISEAEIRRIAAEAQEEQDLAKLGYPSL